MRLVRLGVITFKPGLGLSNAWRWSILDVELEVLNIKKSEGEAGVRHLIAATKTLPDGVSVSEAGTILIPDHERELTEWAIGIAADVLAVAAGASRKISSPFPWLALLPESQEERTLLERCDYDAQASGVSSLIPTAPIEKVLGLLTDRPNGIALLTEVLTHDHPVGQFNELVRFFELAFRTNAKHLMAPLAEFLGSGWSSYTPEEVSSWLSLRNRAVHANRKPGPVLSSTIRPVLPRMLQAAYDVLFNKQEWASKSSVRRQYWMNELSSPGPDGVMRVQLGARGTMQVQILDPFKTFPLDLSGPVQLPADWWVGRIEFSQLKAQVLKAEVVPRKEPIPEGQ